MKKIVAIFYIICSFSLNVFSQSLIYNQEAKLLSTLPFKQLTGGSIILKARIDDFKDSLNFVFDTGSGGISLDSTTVDELKIKKTQSDKIIRGIAGIKKVEYALKHTLNLPNLKVDSLDFHINNYDLLTASYGIKVDGIIGYSFLRQFIIKVDYDNFTIKIYSPGNIKYPKSGYLMKPNFTPLPIYEHDIADQTKTTSNLIFDTGAGLNLLLTNEFANATNLLKKKKHFYPLRIEGLGGQKIMQLTTIKEFKIGKYKFKNVPTMLFDDDFNVTNYPRTGGIVGNDLLRKFNLIINYPDFTIHLKPNSHFAETFDYAYTGMSIYLIDNKITVMDIMPKSPAEKANLKEGDQILALDNNFTATLQAYKTALQNAGNRIKIIVLRDGKPKELTLFVQNIKR
ncbi:MAG: aspartyl protease family protein [Chitinophagaceae bacterium]